MTRSEHTPIVAHATFERNAAFTRRRALGLLGAVLGAATTPVRSVLGQESTPDSTPTIQSNLPGEMPTTGALRPGPVGQLPPESIVSASIPMSIKVEAAGIDAEVEALDIVDGKMEDPTGPWVVSWYRQSAALGEIGNVMLAGHVDYWGVGPSVFYNVRDLVEGDRIDLTGENGELFSYDVVWNETFALEELVSGIMAEIVAPSEDQIATLFTCGGEFDYVNGEYLSRTVIRGQRIAPEPADSTPEA
ncbi:MAG: class F sortase [Chloroflexota bacterium]|nr:class F sortase [Chloroflexota bacterium]